MPGLFTEAQANSLNLKSVELTVQHRLTEMNNKLQRIMESGLNSRVFPSMVNTVNSAIIQGAPTTIVECVTQEMEDLSQAMYAERVIVEDLRFDVSEIQDRINSFMMGSREIFSDGKNTKLMNLRAENRSRE